MNNFADKLIDLIKEKKSIICVGLDPRIDESSSIPQCIIERAKKKAKNEDVINDIAIWLFNKEIIDTTSSIAPIYKPQMAFYERYNALNALKKTIDYVHEKGCLVILDAKRNDIGSTSAAYAYTVFEEFNADAVTINSYFGIDGVKPFTDYIKKGKGVITLLKTSNPSSGEFQDLFSVEISSSDPKTMEIQGKELIDTDIVLVRNYIQMSRLLKKWSENEDIVGENMINGKYGYSCLGGVVGATYPEQLQKIRKEIPKNFILIPGYGAQGGTAKDILHGVNKDGLGAIVNSSRGIIFAYTKEEYKNKYSEEKFAQAAFEEADKMRNDINSALKDSKTIAYEF